MDKRKMILVFLAGALATALVVILVPKVFGPGGGGLRQEEVPMESGEPPMGADYTQAIMELRQMLAANPNDVATLVQLGNLNYDSFTANAQTSFCVESIRYYEKSLALQPGNPNVLTDLGYMYRCVGKFNEAKDRFTMAMKASPTHPQSRMNLGILLYYDLQDNKGAKAAFEEYLRIDPQGSNVAGVKQILKQIEAQAGASLLK